MNKTVQLVKLWGAFEDEHPDCTQEDFFRYQLANKLNHSTEAPPDNKLVPDVNGKLVILLRRIGKFHMSYSNKALEGTVLDQIEEFAIFITIYNMGNPIKSETIYNNIVELSSGASMMIRMKKRDLITEYQDQDDKRVTRLMLTEKGEKPCL